MYVCMYVVDLLTYMCIYVINMCNLCICDDCSLYMYVCIYVYVYVYICVYIYTYIVYIPFVCTYVLSHVTVYVRCLCSINVCISS